MARQTYISRRCSLTYSASNIFIDRYKHTFVLDFAVKVWISVIPDNIWNFKSYEDSSRGSVRTVTRAERDWHAPC